MSKVSSSNSQEALVPKLRFPGFEGEIYQFETVGTLFNHASQRNADSKNGNVITNSAEHGLIPQRDFFDKDIAVEGKTNNYYIIKKGDFVYNPRKSTTAPFGPFNCYCLNDEGIVSPLYTCLTPKHEEYTEFLLWYFRSPAWYSYIYHNGAQGGARHDRVGMTNDLMDGIPVNLPCLREQKKISVFLSALDRRIVVQRKLIDSLKLYKRGVIQRIFSNTEYSEPWSKIRIKDLFENVIDKNHPKEDVLTIIQGFGTTPRKSVDRRISYDLSSLSTYKKVKRDDFIMHLRSFEGGLEIANQNGIVSPAYTILRSKQKISPVFFYAYFRSYEFINNKLRPAVEGIRDGKSINMDTFWNLTIPFPPIKKQDFCAVIFNQIDNIIEVSEKLLRCLADTKQYLLQQMFI